MKIEKETIRPYLQPAFLSCVLVLGLSSVGMSMMIQGLGGYLSKEPLPLQRSLDTLDEQDLAPFRVVGKQQIEDPDVLKSLGTKDYIQWVLEDADGPAGPQRVMLFVTYYPLPDRVPHVPEECYLGGGFQRLGTDAVTFTLHQLDGRTLEAKYLVFGNTDDTTWRDGVHVPVIYFFKVNGRYAGDREEARMTLNKNLFGRSSYFSKVELVFNQGPVTQAQAVLTAQRLLDVVIPVLERDYWPKWGSQGSGVGSQESAAGRD